MDKEQEETALRLTRESQEDRYHRTKNSLEDMLDITISTEEWNACFSDIIDEPYRTLDYLYQSRRRLVDALKVVKEYL